jgi:hypothetical protein
MVLCKNAGSRGHAQITESKPRQLQETTFRFRLDQSHPSHRSLIDIGDEGTRLSILLAFWVIMPGKYQYIFRSRPAWFFTCAFDFIVKFSFHLFFFFRQHSRSWGYNLTQLLGTDYILEILFSIFYLHIVACS